MPLDQRRAERLGDLDGEHGLAGAGLALDQERPLERDRGVDRHLEVVGGHIGASPLKTHEHPLASALRIKHAALFAHKPPDEERPRAVVA